MKIPKEAYILIGTTVVFLGLMSWKPLFGLLFLAVFLGFMSYGNTKIEDDKKSSSYLPNEEIEKELETEFTNENSTSDSQTI